MNMPLTKAYNMIELVPLLFAGGVSMFFEDLALKTVLTVVSLIIATTVTFFYKRWLERKYKEECDEKCKDDETNK